MADLSNYKIFKNENFEILTDTGFQNFEGIIIGDNPNKVRLEFDDGEHLICTPKHKMILPDGSEKFAKDLEIGEDLFDGASVSSIENFQNNDKVYEILHVHNGHKYLVNGKLCKNCLIIDEAAFIQPHIMDEFWNSVIPIISSSSNTKIFLISCVVGDTHVFTCNGIKQVRDFAIPDIIGGYQVNDYSILGKDKLRSGNLFKSSGIAETRKIKSSFSELECSTNHKLWACKDGIFDWYKSEDLREGDYVSVQYGYDVWGNNDDISDFSFIPTNNSCQYGKIPKVINEDIGYFLGLYLSEGYARSVVGGQITITCGDDILKSIQSMGYNVSLAKDGIHYSINSLELIKFLEYLGFDISLKAPKKQIPTRVLSMSKNIIASVLRGMFDGDGTTHGIKGTVSYTSSSEKMIDQLRVILNNFGILSSKCYYRTKPTKLVKCESDRWVLEISGKASKKFYEAIGFGLDRKQCRSELLDSIINRNTLDTIPMKQSDLLSLIKRDKIKHRELKSIGLNITCNLYSKNKNSLISRTKLLDLRNSGLIKSEESLAFLKDILSKNIRWDKIRSIEKSEAEVFDFSLPDGEDGEFSHSIIYNGLIGHQTPNGTSNKFYDIYSAAERGESKEWHHEKMEWHELPGRGKKWKQDMIESLGSTESFDQEFGCVARDTKITLRKKGETTSVVEKISNFFKRLS